MLEIWLFDTNQPDPLRRRAADTVRKRAAVACHVSQNPSALHAEAERHEGVSASESVGYPAEGLPARPRESSESPTVSRVPGAASLDAARSSAGSMFSLDGGDGVDDAFAVEAVIKFADAIAKADEERPPVRAPRAAG